MLVGKKGFRSGKIVATHGALECFETYGINPASYLRRHLNGDWGDLCEEDIETNEEALKHGSRLLSSYKLPSGEKLWIITEADRSVTTFLLPREY